MSTFSNILAQFRISDYIILALYYCFSVSCEIVLNYKTLHKFQFKESSSITIRWLTAHSIFMALRHHCFSPMFQFCSVFPLVSTYLYAILNSFNGQRRMDSVGHLKTWQPREHIWLCNRTLIRDSNVVSFVLYKTHTDVYQVCANV